MRLRLIRPLILRDETDPTQFYLGYPIGPKSEMGTGNFADHWHAAIILFHLQSAKARIRRLRCPSLRDAMWAPSATQYLSQPSHDS